MNNMYLKKSIYILTSAFSIVILLNCRSESFEDKKLFEILGAEQSGILFKNVLNESIERNGLLYEYFYNGGGVAVGDFNNDNLSDIYFVSNQESNKLYLNKGGLKFKDVTKESNTEGTGFPTGVTTVDINGDGYLDIYVCKAGNYKNLDFRKNELYINLGYTKNGIPKFREQAKEYGLDLSLYSTQAAFFDYDRDGDLDVFLINHDAKIYSNDIISRYIDIKGKFNGDRLYRNEKGKFKEVTFESGINNSKLGFGLGLAVGDLNNDGWPDIYVSSDFSDKDHLYINNADGTFTERINQLTKHMSNFSMGNDISDFNNDGLMDIFTVDMISEDNYGIKTSMGGMSPERFHDLVDMGLGNQYMYNTFQMNIGIFENMPYFSEIAQISGLSSTDWSWGPLFFDMDNDGNKDLFISNGIKRDFRNNDFVNYQKRRQQELMMSNTIDKAAYIGEMLSKMPTRKKNNYFFKNDGNLKFTKKNKDWITEDPTASNGSAYADFDNDGDLDLVLNNTDDLSYIIRNYTIEKEKKHKNFLKLKLIGSSQNTLGIGSRVVLKYGNNIQQIQEHYLTRGFQSSVAPGLHFGLGEHKIIDEAEVIWPDGKRQILTKIEANQLLVVNYKDAKLFTKSKDSSEINRMFKDITKKTKLNHKHTENQFDDFKRESLLPHKMSQLGPAIAVGDINGDTLDDFFVGGSIDHASSLYLQKENNTFETIQTDLFEKEKQYEDVGAKFFDADNDGDLDLYVSSGGNEKHENSKYYKDRLYENINGFFKAAPLAIPDIRESGLCIRPFDYDGDGDQDLFIGGRQIPGKYPLPPSSYILQNNSKEKGKLSFTDVTNKLCPKLKNLGMVTDALWIDIDNDGMNDLVITGEWMPVTIFKYNGNTFEDATKYAGVFGDVGWWYSISAADFDNDGDIDLVVGNLGLNYKYKATKEEPFEIYTTDFDESGDLDIVLGYNSEGSLYPLRGRECSSNEMPYIKSKFPTYDSFGKATLKEVYGESKLQKSTHYVATNFATSYFENDGNGQFKIIKLPIEAQVSSVNSILVEDFNKDGHLDLLMAGNMYGSEVETPRNDASYGLYLAGDGSGNFTVIPSNKSGLKIEGEVKQIMPLKMSEGKETILIAINNGKLILLEK